MTYGSGVRGKVDPNWVKNIFQIGRLCLESIFINYVLKVHVLKYDMTALAFDMIVLLLRVSLYRPAASR
jgi:hypothetical protein